MASQGKMWLQAGAGLLVLGSIHGAWSQTSAYYTSGTGGRVAQATLNIANFTWGATALNRMKNGDSPEPPTYYVNEARIYGRSNVLLSGTYAGSRVPEIITNYGSVEDFLWELVPDTKIYRWAPKDNYTPTYQGTGGDIVWGVDPIAHPFKVRDLGSGTANEWYPKNDFHNYYLMGIDSAATGGRFDASRADIYGSQFLVNTDTGGTMSVDRGYGDGFDAVYTGTTIRIHPIRCYSKFLYTAYTVPLLNSLSQRALVDSADSNAKNYCAYYGLFLLSRLAFVYPDYTATSSPTNDRRWVYEQVDSDPAADTGTTDNGGMITGRIWETYGIEAFALAYDALRPWLYAPGNVTLRDNLLMELFTRGMFNHTPSPAELDTYIRVHLLQPAMYALEQRKVIGNPGMHQAAALAAAMAYNQVSGSTPNTTSTIEAMYGGYKGLRYLAINSLWRDGGPYESVGYGDSWLKMVRTNQYMDVVRGNFSGSIFPTSTYPDIFAGDKGKAIFDFFMDIAPQERFSPAFGDTTSQLLPVVDKTPRLLAVKEYYYAWEKLEKDDALPKKYSRYLRAAGLAGTVTSGTSTWPEGELFSKFPATQTLDANKPLEWANNSKIKERGRLMPAYGVGILEQGKGDNRRSLMLNFTSLIGHRQFDPLTVEMSARNLQLLPDLGYPKDLQNYRWQYDAHTMASNTVTVDETRGSFDGVYTATNALVSTGGISLAQGRLAVQAGPLQIVEASADPYPSGYYQEPFRWTNSAWQNGSLSSGTTTTTAAQGVSIYDRADAMIEVDSTRSYVVDVFSVNGGTVHDQSWHAREQAPVDPGLTWSTTIPTTATLAASESGTAVPRFGEYKDQWGRYNVKGHFPSYVADMKKATMSVSSTIAVNWTWTATAGSGPTLDLNTFRLHVVPIDGNLEAIRCNASAPNRPVGGGYEEMPYLLLRRSATAGARTRYVSVLEHYSGTSVGDNVPTIQSVTVVDKPANYVTLEIVHTRGKDRVTIATPNTASGTTAFRPVGARLQRWSNVSEAFSGTTSKTVDVTVGEPLGSGTSKFIQASITALDRNANEIRIPNTAASLAECVVGRTIRISNASRSSLYGIAAVGSNPTDILLTLDRTAVLAQGKVTANSAQRVDLDSDIEFANGSFSSGTTGYVKKGWVTRDHVAGAWIGDGAQARQLLGAVQSGTTGDPGTAVFLTGTNTYGGALNSDATIYEYGVGDSVEIPKISYLAELPYAGSRTMQLVLPTASGSAFVEVTAWLKQTQFAGYNRALKVKWNGTYLSGTGRPAYIVRKDSGSTTTNSTLNGQLLPYCPDPSALEVDNGYYFRMETDADVLNIFDLVKVRFPIPSPVSGTHTVIIENASGTGVTQPMVIGNVQARWGSPTAP